MIDLLTLSMFLSVKLLFLDTLQQISLLIRPNWWNFNKMVMKAETNQQLDEFDAIKVEKRAKTGVQNILHIFFIF